MIKTNKPKISVVIPVYNGGKYLRQTVDCLKNQTFRDFEVILVEDFSTDDSMTFIQSVAKTDNRMKIIRRKQKGGTGTKGVIYGLSYCKGDYFFYMSQDDLIENDTFEKLYNKALETGADIVVPNMVWYFDDEADHGGLYYDENKEIDSKEAFLLSLRWKIHGFNLKKMELIKKVGFDDLYYNSDEYASRIQYFYANKVAFCNTKFFYRQDNPNAITKDGLKPFKFEILPNASRLVDFMIKQHLQGEKEFSKFIVRIFRIYKRFATSSEILTFNADDRKRINQICFEFRRDFLRQAIQTKKILFILRALRIFLIKPKK